MKKINTTGLVSFTILLILVVMGIPLWIYFFGDGSLPSMGYMFFSFILFGVILILILRNLNSGGSLFSEGKDKIKVGPFEEFYPNGNLKLVGNFIDGKRVGDWREYFENGVLKEKGSYTLGKKDGVFQIFEIGGEKVEELVFELGVLKVSLKLKNKLLHGIQKYFDDDGILLRTLIYEDGKIIEGLWESYHENDELSEKGKYLNGVRNGLWEFYYENGQLMETGEFKNGEKIGKWKFFDFEGKLQLK